MIGWKLHSAKVMCNICGSHSDWLMYKRGYDLYRCKSCSHIFVYPIPSKKELQKIYSFECGYHAQKPFIFSENYNFENKFEKALEMIGSEKNSGLILDVGCSNGEFCVLAKRRGYKTLGIELNPDSAAIARMNGIEVRNGTLEFIKLPDNSFDIIHLGDLIEHIPDVHEFMDKIKTIIMHGGLLYIQTPNHDAFFPKSTLSLYKYGIPWSHPTPPHHLNQFTPQSMRLLLETHGFFLKEISYTKCSLRYEIGATYVLSDLKRSFKDRDICNMFHYAVKTVAVLLTYIPIWILDRLIRGERDFNMHILAIKT